MAQRQEPAGSLAQRQEPGGGHGAENALEMWGVLLQRVMLFLFQKHGGRFRAEDESKPRKWDLVRMQFCPLSQLEKEMAVLMEEGDSPRSPAFTL